MRDKRARFVELANSRVNKTINQLRLVGNLANRSNYDFDDDDARKILKALQRELDALKQKFAGATGLGAAEFTL